MIAKLQRLYDRMYFLVRADLTRFACNYIQWKAMRGVKFDREFYRAYKEQVVPYWKQYGLKPKIWWSKQQWLLRGYLDPHSIPYDVHFRYIIPHFNEHAFIRALNDKNLHHLICPGVKRPETVFKRSGGYLRNDDLTVISVEEVYVRLAQEGRFIVKPARDSGEGHSISFLDGPVSPTDVDAMLKKYGSRDIVVQRVLAQHPALAAFNASSLNTVRVETLLFKGKVHVLSAVLRIGRAGSQVDNTAQGGYQVAIRPDGTLDKLAYTHKPRTSDGRNFAFVEQTGEGMRFEGFAVPSWEKIRDLAVELAPKMPHMAILGWDFAVDPSGEVVLIEFNCQFGPNQDESCGPTFGDMTDEVLAEVFGKK